MKSYYFVAILLVLNLLIGLIGSKEKTALLVAVASLVIIVLLLPRITSKLVRPVE